MEYRPLGKTGLNVSAISLGTEYLEKASAETVCAVVRAAVDQGINYFDVILANPDYRDAFGKAFQGLRDRVIITTHLPTNDPIERCEALFHDALARLRVDCIDVVFVSCCDGDERYRKAMGPRIPGEAGGQYELAAELVRQGKARFIALSTHAVPVAMRAVTSGQFNLLMFPVNPAFDALPGATGADDLSKLWDEAYVARPGEVPAGMIPERRQLYLECARREVGLVAMKPFAAGWLFVPELNTGFTPVNLLHYALSQPGVSCVVPGANGLEQLAQDLSCLTASAEEKDYSAALSRSRWNSRGACMYCSHCQPCTAGIDIAEVNRLLDRAAQGSVMERIQQAYDRLEARASECQECGDCQERCPFGIPVMERMKQAAGLFEGRTCF